VSKPCNAVALFEISLYGFTDFFNNAGIITPYECAVVTGGVESSPVSGVERYRYRSDQDVVILQPGNWYMLQSCSTSVFAYQPEVLVS
jgi:hypothetical protein